MAAYKLLKALKANLKEIEDTDKKNNNWFGHWVKSIKIKSIKHRIEEIENNLKNKKHNDKKFKNT